MQSINLKNKFLFAFLLVTFQYQAYAQDDLMSMLDSMPAKSERVLATFKTTRIVNAHSVETVKARHLDFRVSHHFGDAGGKNGGFHSMYGLDAASDIRIAFEYGISERLTAGIGRSKIGELFDGYLKYRLLFQTEDNKVPLSLTLFANTAVTAIEGNGTVYQEDFLNRLSYTYQALIARKFSSRFSLQLMPAFLHRNYVSDARDENDMFVLGGGARLKITKRFALLADYYFIFSKLRMDNSDIYFPPLGLGLEIETGGHVFHIFFTNNPAIVENTYFAQSTDSWSKGQMKLGFNISRTFGIGKKSRM
jgi:hypothetical protein